MAEQNVNAQKLQDLLSFDPSKRHPLAQDALADVVKEIKEEKTKAVKAQAKDLLTKAIELRGQMVQLDKQYVQTQNKFNKELGKVLNQINGMLSGQEPPVEQEKEEQKEEQKQE